MSKVGKKPILIPQGVTVTISGESVEVKGNNATLSLPILDGLEIKQEGSEITISTLDSTKQSVSNWGTMRALLQNAVSGSTENFSKSLILEGVGYRANVDGNALAMSLGFSHPVRFEIPEGISIKAENNVITISGADKAQVGEVAAKIRDLKKPEPYKGKGMRYSDEVIKKKAGKKAVGSEGA